MEQEQQSIASLYDFIYLDTARLTSYLSQLDDDGVLLSIRRKDEVAEEQNELNSVGYNSTKSAQENNRSRSKDSEKHYDSKSTALYSVIDRLGPVDLSDT